MRESADVRSIDALKDARAALAEFCETARLALSEATSDVQRTHWWLQNDRKAHWRSELRRRQEKLQQAKSEYHRAQLQAQGSSMSTREQRKLVERAKYAVEEAEHKIRAVSRWETLFEREMTLFRGQIQSLGRAVDGDLPKADHKLVRMIEQLEQYTRLRVGGETNRPAPPSAPDAGKDDA